MDNRTWGAMGGLVAAVVVLAVALTVVLVRDGDGGTTTGMGPGGPAGMPMGGGSMGMMRAMAMMDSDAMLARMREVLGDEDFQLMLAHFEEHRQGRTMGPHPDIDQMMHRMMDGLLELMPADSDGVMPMRPR